MLAIPSIIQSILAFRSETKSVFGTGFTRWLFESHTSPLLGSCL